MISFNELVTLKEEDKHESAYDLESMYKALEKMNLKLIALEKSKERFLSLVRNSFDNPLYGMISLQKQLNKSLKTQGCKDDYELSDIIYDETLKLNFQLANIMSVAEVETGLLEKEFVYFNIRDLLKDIFNALEYIYKDKPLKIVENIAIGDDIYNDRDKMYAILVNLIANASQFSPRDSEITIDIHEDEDLLYFCVTNKGDEIKEKQDIFDAFFQEESGYSREYQGLGIGLSVTKAYIEFLGDNIFVSREGDINVFVANIPNVKDKETTSFGRELDSFMFD